MAAIIEKGSEGLFENEIEINGKYANYARFLKDQVGLFLTFRELYVNAIIIGFLYNIKESNDSNIKVQSASIFSSDLSKRKSDLRFLYRMIMLLDNKDDFTLDDYMNRTFRDDSEEDRSKLKANMAILNSYACGGIEYLYNKFQNSDGLGDTVDIMYEWIKEFCIEQELLEDDELDDFSPEIE